MIFSWWTRRRRARLQAQRVPAEWDSILDHNVLCAGRLDEPDYRRLLQRMQVFIAEKHWEGVAGLELTEEMRVTIAAQACYLVLGIPDEYYDNVLSILVYPRAYVAPDQTTLPSGIVIEGGQARMGEAWYRGPVILSWEDALYGGREETDGSNLVFHEFAHQLDMQNGRQIDGTPPLPTDELARRWPQVMESAYQRLIEECHSGWNPFLDCYGTTNRAEFFAVATEAYFCTPEDLQYDDADLFDVLDGYYRRP